MRTNGFRATGFAALLAFSTMAGGSEVVVKLANTPAQGALVLLLFDSANAFGDLRDPAYQLRQPLDGRQSFRIADIAPGEYALLAYLDENDNGLLDRNFIGIPKEPLGFSNRYRPRGPPSYSRAAFVVLADESREFELDLARPLGPSGRFGVGLAVIASASPYREAEGAVTRAIPAVTYIGAKLQILGPFVQYSLTGSGDLRLAATGRLRLRAYEEADSDFLSGMGDREDTFMAGLAVRAELPGGLGLSLGYDHDILDRIGGGEARLELDKSFQAGRMQFSPGIALNWLSASIADHDFGVPADRATAERPAYRAGSATSVELGLSTNFEVTEALRVFASIAVERFGREITDSPLVEDEQVVKGFAAISYSF